MVRTLIPEIEKEILSVLIIGLIFIAVYVLSSRRPLFRTEKSVSPYTAGITYNGEQFAQVSDMVIFLSILLAVESLTISLFFVSISPWIIILFSASLVATLLGYYAYLEER